MGVYKKNGTPKSSILIGFSIINHPFWGTGLLYWLVVFWTNPSEKYAQAKLDHETPSFGMKIKKTFETTI